MKCPMCGENIRPQETRCPSCGMSLQSTPDARRFGAPPPFPGSQSPVPPPPGPQYNGYNGNNGYNGPERGITKRMFRKHYASADTKTSLLAAAVILYICAAINLFVGYIPDAALLLVLGLVIHLLGSRVGAVIQLVYSVVSCIITSLMRGQFSGWFLILAGIVAVRGAFALEREYRNFQGR